jgi:hypothetical protein
MGEEPENSYNKKLYTDLQERNNSDEKLQTRNREYLARNPLPSVRGA